MNDRIRIASWGLPPLLILLVTCGSGCTAVLSSASLRELVRGGDEHAAESARIVSDDPARPASATLDEAAEPDSNASPETDRERREAAIEEAVARLARLGGLGESARASLVDTLDRTQQEDWPAVIEAFAASLEDAGITVAVPPDPSAEAGDAVVPPEVDAHIVAKADLDAAVIASQATPATAAAAPRQEPESPAEPVAPAMLTAAEAPTEPVETPPAEAAAAAGQTEPAAGPSAAATGGRLAVQNACFASRVQGWGVVDRFPVDRFRPGQEVIVYFELDNLSAGESPAGHTTCIDTALRLVAADGQLMHAWRFEPIAETCRARRHDYFARYVVRLPETAASGDCRLDLEVTDTLGRQVAATSLPLEVLPPARAE